MVTFVPSGVLSGTLLGVFVVGTVYTMLQPFECAMGSKAALVTNVVLNCEFFVFYVGVTMCFEVFFYKDCEVGFEIAIFAMVSF